MKQTHVHILQNKRSAKNNVLEANEIVEIYIFSKVTKSSPSHFEVRDF